MLEKWKGINTHPNYAVSNLGRVKNIIKNKILIHRKISGGYVGVALYANRKRKDFRIHQLVTLKFIGKKPHSFVINHKDGIKTNNVYSNLEYMTHSENVKHAYRLGLTKKRFGNLNPARMYPEKLARGENHPHSKLNWKQVKKIRKKYLAGGVGHRTLAKQFNVGRLAVRDIVKNITWRT